MRITAFMADHNLGTESVDHLVGLMKWSAKEHKAIADVKSLRSNCGLVENMKMADWWRKIKMVEGDVKESLGMVERIGHLVIVGIRTWKQSTPFDKGTLSLMYLSTSFFNVVRIKDVGLIGRKSSLMSPSRASGFSTGSCGALLSYTFIVFILINQVYTLSAQGKKLHTDRAKYRDKSKPYCAIIPWKEIVLGLNSLKHLFFPSIIWIKDPLDYWWIYFELYNSC